jgi:prepilin-type N-terminal cleavage/methylation domain-containing protein
MSIAVVKCARRRGFTLLEVTLAVAILAMMAMAIYRFVATNLIVLRISSQHNAAEARYTGFINLLTAQLQQLPSGVGALTGEPFKFSDQSRDKITWICGSGPGLLTRYAPGEFLVDMRLRPVNDKSDQMEIGFNRKPRDTAEGDTSGESWVPVLDDVRSLEIRYFDPRLNVWVEKWTDTIVMPRLIKLVIGRPDRPEPYEAIIALGRTPLPIVVTLQPVQTQQPLQGQTGPPGQPGKPGQPGPPGQPGSQPPTTIKPK